MKFDSIQTRLTGIAILFIIGTSITMGGVGLSLTMKFLKQRFHQNFIVLSEYLARNAELGVLLQDTDMLESLAGNMLDQEDVVKVSITDLEGRVLAGREKKKEAGSIVKIRTPVSQIQPDSGEMSLYKNFKSDELLGYVELFYADSGFEGLTRQMTLYFIVISIVLSLFPVTWYWLVSRSITAPLNDLLDVSRRVSRGDLDVRARGGNLNETKTLALAFNEMLESVKTHQQKTEKAHREMARQSSLAEIGKFSTMVAHELKNPIAIIKGSLDIFKKEDLDDDTRLTMGVYLDEEVQRLNRLVEEFLLFAKPKKINFSKVSMKDFFSDLIEKYRFTSNDKNLKLFFDSEEAWVDCDVNLMERAVSNIMKNAVEHSDPFGAVIDIQGRRTADEYVVQIRDNGNGIDDQHLQGIFTPFFTTRAKGTGLGLAIVRDILQLHNGSVTAFNRKSGGACFEIRMRV
ncbi:MAG: HAMP domain-containing sensor histidine kinase [Thermodesulfobacteriota bacterium]|nr:HAMP domain-containing sensor histidine kinase [Thermodesulfobacteriota bacterium]